MQLSAKTIETLWNLFLQQECCNLPGKISEGTLPHASTGINRRTAKPYERGLLTEGYLEECRDPRTEETGPRYYRATGKIVEHVAPVYFDLMETWLRRLKESEQRRLPYVYFSELSQNEQRYALEHMQDYTWYLVPGEIRRFPQFYEAEGRKEIVGPLPLPLKPNIDKEEARWRAAGGNRFNSPFRQLETLALQNDQFLVRHADYQHQKKVNSVFSENLGWLLEDLGLITAEESAKILSDGKPAWINAGNSCHNFGDNPNEWGSNLTAGIDKMLRRLSDAQSMLALLIKIDRAVRTKGGWPTFIEEGLARIDKRLRDAVDKKDAESKENQA